jgi:hypothetical protein
MESFKLFNYSRQRHVLEMPFVDAVISIKLGKKDAKKLWPF